MSAAKEKLIFAPKNDQYTTSTLSSSDLSPSPLSQFHTWYTAAQSHPTYQPETATLSTARLPSGRVSARTVYLKELDARGFVVYSNWATSKKAADIASNPRAALTFHWREMERQVRVEGVTERLTEEESQVYFDTRIRGSRIGAWASRQSQGIEGREVLEGWVEEAEERFKGVEEIPVPPFWGGSRVVPDYVEFWFILQQGRPSRLHDRFAYTRDSIDSDTWKVQRLSP
ncbi:pyridoxamine 5'-phosphate oxidase [Choiromyces venosus 120613-1]|uniref:pyridoxal 5'-phosphate synthase n=1 Tax=Choiromyces venosus 120613-1 TaxID=1336337 RepID=A0A3N4K4Y4_9PEZI|nr:pyridoxamine 5'-phosphate oxidase [Choiromyces venosus 120613-1]